MVRCLHLLWKLPTQKWVWASCALTMGVLFFTAVFEILNFDSWGRSVVSPPCLQLLLSDSSCQVTETFWSYADDLMSDIPQPPLKYFHGKLSLAFRTMNRGHTCQVQRGKVRLLKNCKMLRYLYFIWVFPLYSKLAVSNCPRAEQQASSLLWVLAAQETFPFETSHMVSFKYWFIRFIISQKPIPKISPAKRYTCSIRGPKTMPDCKTFTWRWRYGIFTEV